MLLVKNCWMIKELCVRVKAQNSKELNSILQLLFLGDAHMPIVHVNVWEGFGEEKAKLLIRNITRVFEDLGIPKQSVEVLVHEISGKQK